MAVVLEKDSSAAEGCPPVCPWVCCCWYWQSVSTRPVCSEGSTRDQYTLRIAEKVSWRRKNCPALPRELVPNITAITTVRVSSSHLSAPPYGGYLEGALTMVVVVVMVVVVTDSEAWAKAVAAGLGDWDSAAVLCAVSFALGSEQLCPPFLGPWRPLAGTGSLARELLLAVHPIICLCCCSCR